MTDPDPVEQAKSEPQARPFVWPCPKHGIPSPPSKKQIKRDEREELNRLGEGLF